MFDVAGLRSVAQRLLPVRVRRWLWILRGFRHRKPVIWVRFGSLRRVTPIDPNWGYERGLPVDRYYIERFLSSCASDVRGRVLEIEEDTYTRRLGGGRVTESDVLHITEGNPRATIVGDLTDAEHIPSDAFDCIIFTQTLHVIYDMRAAVKTLHRILKPGGVLLATFPGVSQVSRKRRDDYYWCWLFTRLSSRRLFEEAFPAANVEVESYGNVLAAVALLHGLASEDLRRAELDYRDPDYEVLVTLRAVKATS